MRNIRLSAIVLAALVGQALWAGGNDAGLAAESHAFIIAANDGYGIDDCLAEGGECGRAVADAWCQAHGHVTALSFGRAEDVTGAIGQVGLARTGPPYFVTCGD